MICPACKEQTDSSVGDVCTVCGTEIPAREIEARYPVTTALVDKRFRWLMTWGVGVAALSAGLAYFLSVATMGLLGWIVTAVLYGFQLLLLRLWIYGPIISDVSRTRRLTIRWTAAGMFHAVGIPGYLMSAAPFAAILKVVVFPLATWVVYKYSTWSYRNELHDKPIATWEKLLLAAVFMGLAGFLMLVVLLAASVGFAAEFVAKLVEALQVAMTPME